MRLYNESKRGILVVMKLLSMVSVVVDATDTHMGSKEQNLHIYAAHAQMYAGKIQEIKMSILCQS